MKYFTIWFPPLELRYPGHGEAEAGGEQDGGEEEDQAEVRPHAGRGWVDPASGHSTFIPTSAPSAFSGLPGCNF